MDKILRFLFSCRGNISRHDYLFAWGALVTLEIFVFHIGAILFLIANFMAPPEFSTDTPSRGVLLLLLPLYISQTSLAARRLHALGHCGLWALLGPLSSLLYFLAGNAFIDDVSAHWFEYTPPGQDSLGLGAGLMCLLGLTPWIGQFLFLLIGLPEEKHIT